MALLLTAPVAKAENLVELQLPVPAEELNSKPASSRPVGTKFGVVLTAGQSAEVVLPVLADTNLRKDRPVESQGAQPGLVLRYGREQQALIKVDPAKARGVEFTEAEFQFLPSWVAKREGGTISFHRMLVDWSEQANTLVIFSTDHGDLAGHHGFLTKYGPCMDETILRIPLVMRWPDGIPPGQVTDSFVSSVDLLPTLCSLAERNVPAACHGHSLLPLFEGVTAVDWREGIACSY